MKEPKILKHRVLPVLAGLLLTPVFLHAQEADQKPGNKSAPPANMAFSLGLGYGLFQDNCAKCHGAKLDGTDQGPPLLHGYYKPSHHSDAAFYRAIELGTPQHHWNFGDMDPVEGVSRKQAKSIVQFVRWFQREYGLY